MAFISIPLPRVSRQRRLQVCVCSSTRDLPGLPDQTPIALGTWAWGNRILYGYEPSQDKAIQETFEAALTRGVSLIDTADSYGTGQYNARAETLLGKFMREAPAETRGVTIATKFASYPWRTRSSIVRAAEASCERLGRVVDLGQIHWSVSTYAPWQERALWDGIADAKDRGFVKEIGVSNFGPNQLTRVEKYLREERGIKLCSIQTQFSLLSRAPLDGVIPTARKLGLGVIGYSPLACGFLAGGTAKGLRGFLYNRLQNRRLMEVLDALARKYSCQKATIALAWCLQQPIITLVGCRTPAQLYSNLNALSVRLTPEDIGLLEGAAQAGAQMIVNAFETA